MLVERVRVMSADWGRRCDWIWQHTLTHIETESQKVTYAVRNTPTLTCDCMTDSSMRHGENHTNTHMHTHMQKHRETCCKLTPIISSMAVLNITYTIIHTPSPQGLCVSPLFWQCLMRSMITLPCSPSPPSLIFSVLINLHIHMNTHHAQTHT